MPRCFLGLPLTSPTVKALLGVQNRLLKEVPQGGRHSAAKKLRPVPEANFHLTLRFLGSTPDAQVETIIDTLGPTLKEAWSPGDVLLAGLGAFPTPRRPRAVFAQVVEGGDRVVQLGAAIDGFLEALGTPPDSRPRHPHVTVCRVTDPLPGGPLTDWISDYPTAPLGMVNTEAVVLYESETRQTGSVYTPLHRWRLS